MADEDFREQIYAAADGAAVFELLKTRSESL
jgi:hypothetical protein